MDVKKKILAFIHTHISSSSLKPEIHYGKLRDEIWNLKFCVEWKISQLEHNIGLSFGRYLFCCHL